MLNEALCQMKEESFMIGGSKNGITSLVYLKKKNNKYQFGSVDAISSNHELPDNPHIYIKKITVTISSINHLILEQKIQLLDYWELYDDKSTFISKEIQPLFNYLNTKLNKQTISKSLYEKYNLFLNDNKKKLLSSMWTVYHRKCQKEKVGYLKNFRVFQCFMYKECDFHLYLEYIACQMCYLKNIGYPLPLDIISRDVIICNGDQKDITHILPDTFICNDAKNYLMTFFNETNQQTIKCDLQSYCTKKNLFEIDLYQIKCKWLLCILTYNMEISKLLENNRINLLIQEICQHLCLKKKPNISKRLLSMHEKYENYLDNKNYFKSNKQKQLILNQIKSVKKKYHLEGISEIKTNVFGVLKLQLDNNNVCRPCWC